MRSLLLPFLLIFTVARCCHLTIDSNSSVSDVLEHIRKGRIALHELSKFENASKIPELADTVGRLTLDWPTIRKGGYEGRLLMRELKDIRDGLSQLQEDYKLYTYQLGCPLHPSYYDDVRMRIINSFENVRMDWDPPRANASGFQLCHECLDILIRLKMTDSNGYSSYIDTRFCSEEQAIKAKKGIAKADVTLLAVMSKMCGYFLPQTMDRSEHPSEFERLEVIDKEIYRIIRGTQF
ncbi:hypothetical protein QR680_003689 [Steinernema hermaphroditum]|uniref:Prolyl 4-hydroxylase alpha-subunit N-terminal domain-containing protein n=1 Tax=Steinernema hermaphroditum TaxID=289476 RepID=A0AA39LSP5_9BILA|nr:hypothetical protein QR680_003689 [Steinernema hermaphroditum]